MEKNFTSPLIGKTPYSPRSRHGIGTPKRGTASNFGDTSLSGKSTQSVRVILSTPSNYVERFGVPLPVLVTEALTFADKNATISARISEHGYAWIVCGRRLLIWQYRQYFTTTTATQIKKPSSSLSHCYELQLPQSDLAHRAELVTILLNNDRTTTTPGCIAVSPEGVVRYWPTIKHENVSIEQQINLNGQECESLYDIDENFGCILTTTTCTVLLIQPQFLNGKYLLKSKLLKPPTGWLGGISRRMSSLIFGPIQNEQSSETKLIRVLSIVDNKNKESSSAVVYILADHSLQKWQLYRNQQECIDELVYAVELNRLIRDSFRNALWENSPPSSPATATSTTTTSDQQQEIITWLLDIQQDKDNIILLAAAVNLLISPRVHYAMICLQTNTNQPPIFIKDFLLLKINDLFNSNDDGEDDGNLQQILSYRFLLCGICAYLYNQKMITIIKPQEEPDILDFNKIQPFDYLLAGTICVNTPIFFTRNHGLITIINNDLNTINNSDINKSFDQQSQQHSILEQSSFTNEQLNNLSIFNIDPDDINTTTNKTTSEQLKSAFIYHSKKQYRNCNEILDELFPKDKTKLQIINSLLDKSVIKLCIDTIDDVPLNDPRYKSTTCGLGSSYSMQIERQLQDKQCVFLLFVKFLQDVGLIQQLNVCTIRNTQIATIFILSEFIEKITTLIALREKQKQQIGNSLKLLDRIIEKNVELTDDELENGLTHQDIFYCHVSKAYMGIHGLVNYCEDLCHSDTEPGDLVDVINQTNEIILYVFEKIFECRQKYAEIFTLNNETIRSTAPDYLPWTAANGREGLADALIQLHYITYNYGILITNNERQKQIFWDQLVSLTDLLLDGRRLHLNSIKGTNREDILYKQYCADRQKYMKIFLKEKQWERATKLAEKYLDFETLIIICDTTNNQQRLEEYIERYNNEKFSEYLYNWYLKENKQGKLIEYYRKATMNSRNESGSNSRSKSVQQFNNFLTNHPTLSWIQDIFDKRYETAADTLQNLANNETDSLTRQKTMYSLCKLAKLASITTTTAPITDNNSDNDLQNIRKRTELIHFQEDLPDYVLQYYGYDTINPKVLTPKELIELYISKCYKEAGELEFKKALDLLEFINDDDDDNADEIDDDGDLKQELLLKIWTAAILRDQWEHSNLEAPLDILQNKLFFRLIDFIIISDGSLKQLPPLELLLEHESLKELKNLNSFQFLMKTGYEYVYRNQMMQ